MKKVLMVLVIALAVTAVVSAQSFTVQSVSGRVQREASNRMVNIATGDTLSADTVIHTGIGATLILKEGDKTFTVPAGQNGKKVSELIGSGSGIRIGGNVTQSHTGTINRNVAQVSTASARASDAAADDDVSAE